MPVKRTRAPARSVCGDVALAEGVAVGKLELDDVVVFDVAPASRTRTPFAKISSTMAAFEGSSQKSITDCANTGPTPLTCMSAACARLPEPPFAAASDAFLNASNVT